MESMESQVPVRLPPWEHHASGAMPIPRFNYTAAITFASSLKGFLVTCPLDREKSATKEAMGILREYLKLPLSTVRLGLDSIPEGPASENVDTGRGEDSASEVNRVTEAKQCTSCLEPKGSVMQLVKSKADSCTYVSNINAEAAIYPVTPAKVNSDEKAVPSFRSTDSDSLEGNKRNTGDVDQDQAVAVNQTREPAGSRYSLSCVLPGVFVLKMAQKGIITIFLPEETAYDPVTILHEVLEDIDSRVRSPPQWCQRMIPVQGSCAFCKDDLTAVVIMLVKKHFATSDEHPLKFAVAYNKRGLEAKQSDDCKALGSLGRMECINIVAEAVGKAIAHAMVDLTAPMMVVVVEVIPVAGIQGPPICGVAVVPGEMVNTKPKLCLKPLVSTAHRTKKLKQ